ncbi:MAG: class II aldolase/adducin family protein [Verrucomicrobiales bacterium]
MNHLQALLDLSHQLGQEARALAILGEGNTSVATPSDKFLVKASGSTLGQLQAEQVVSCRQSDLVKLVEGTSQLSHEETDQALLDARVEENAPKPSVEALFHAWLLTLPDVQFVGHTHPVRVNGVLCSPRAEEFAQRRLFPDEIVCCGVASVLVPYCDPGLTLARVIRSKVLQFIEDYQRPPRVILLENHGLIALGSTAAGVLAATFMAEKAAGIFLGAAACGGPRFLPPQEVERIAGRPDEHYRQRALGMAN